MPVLICLFALPISILTRRISSKSKSSRILPTSLGLNILLLSARRAELHRAAAAWYDEHDPVLRAKHLDRANDPDAAAAYLDAAEAQTAVLHFETALGLTGRGIELAEDPATKCDLMCLRGDALRDTGATEESIAEFQTALVSTIDDVRRCRAWKG